MSDCCGKTKTDVNASCACGKSRSVLLYSCSGGANVAEIADRTARELMFADEGMMACLAGIGGGIQGMIQSAKDADVNLVIDGCPMGCAKKVFDNAGIAGYRYLMVTELGIEKVKGVRCTPQQVTQVLSKAREVLTT